MGHVLKRKLRFTQQPQLSRRGTASSAQLLDRHALRRYHSSWWEPGAQLLDNNGEGGDSIDAHITWQHGESLLWTVPRDGVATEYIRLIFREIDELVVNRTAVAMLVDVRATDVPNAASRAEIVAGVNALADSLCGLALLTGQSVRQKFVVQV